MSSDQREKTSYWEQYDRFIWYYSYDDEKWWPARSRDQAVKAGRTNLFGRADYPGQDFSICEANKIPISDRIFDYDSVIHRFEDRNHDCWGKDQPREPAASAEAQRELEDALNAAFAAWRAEHGDWGSWCFNVERNTERIRGSKDEDEVSA